MKKGFTLVEVIIVLVIVALLALIVIPVMTNIFSNFSRSGRQAQADQVYQSASTYYTENRNQIGDLAAFWGRDLSALPGDLLYETWDDNPSGDRWGCISANRLVERGNLRSESIRAIREEHDWNRDQGYVVLISRPSGQPGVDTARVRILDDFALVREANNCL